MKKSPQRPEHDGDDSGGLRQTALNLLARREHSERELEYKLTGRGYPAADVAALVRELAGEGWLSNTRFAEQYIHSRMQRGFGPLRICAELRERGIEDGALSGLLDSGAADWDRQAAAARSKRFGTRGPADFKDRARQMRFLQQRGFTHDQIRNAFDDDGESGPDQ